MQLLLLFLLTPKIFWLILILDDRLNSMKDQIYPLFTNFYLPYFTLSLAEKKHKRKDIVLFYENVGSSYIYTCSKSISYFGIKPGMPVNFVKKITNNFFLLPCYEFIEEKNYFKELLKEKLKSYAFAVYDIPYYTANPLSYDSFSLVADFSGCQLLYKPIFAFLESFFKSCTKIDKRLVLSFFTSNSFSFSLFVASDIILNLEKNFSFIFYNSNQLSNLIKLSNILSPLTFFEESGILYFSDFIKFPSSFQEKLLSLLLLSSPLSSRIKLANRLKPLWLAYQSIQKNDLLDLFIFNLMHKIFDKNKNSKYEITIDFPLPTNNKNAIQSAIRKRLFAESYFLKSFWLKSKSKQISVILEFSNLNIDHFELFFENLDVLSFFNSISEMIVSRLKSKVAVSSVRLEFDKRSCQQLFEDDLKTDDEKLLTLFDNLIQKFGEEKIHLAG